MKKCATCWNGTGTVDSYWLCDRCKSDPANADWVVPNVLEILGFEADDIVLPAVDPVSAREWLFILAYEDALEALAQWGPN